MDYRAWRVMIIGILFSLLGLAAVNCPENRIQISGVMLLAFGLINCLFVAHAYLRMSEIERKQKIEQQN